MNANKVYIYNPYKESHGISIIVEKLCKIFADNKIEVSVVSNINNIPADSCIIPYGLDGAKEMIHKGYKLDFAFMADAFTLGYLNKIKFFIKHFRVFNYDFYYSIYCYLRDYKDENVIISKFPNTILVSNTDINYFKQRRHSKTNYICLPNGVDISAIAPKTNSSEIRLGILSSWGHKVTSNENRWFIEGYYKRFIKDNPNVTLLLAGRGEYINEYKDINNVKILGEVENLNDFFKNIDIFIAANPKGCGILNRVLDAFAHKTPVLGHKNAFSGFRYMKDSYVEFSTYKEFENSLKNLIHNSKKRKAIADNAFETIKRYNNWDNNYTVFVKDYFKTNNQ